jgi:hypothetical protein
LEIARNTIQTIDGTLTFHVSARCAIQTSVVARCILMFAFLTFFALRRSISIFISARIAIQTIHRTHAIDVLA